MGHHRTYALALLRCPPEQPTPAPRRRLWARACGPAEIALLHACWELTDELNAIRAYLLGARDLTDTRRARLRDQQLEPNDTEARHTPSTPRSSSGKEA